MIVIVCIEDMDHNQMEELGRSLATSNKLLRMADYVVCVKFV